jgi:hypothetical protein
LNRDGKLGGIRNHDIGLGHGAGNAVEDQLPLNGSPAGDDLRVALHVLHFFADFLVGHPQVLLKLPALQAVIEHRQNQ